MLHFNLNVYPGCPHSLLGRAMIPYASSSLTLSKLGFFLLPPFCFAWFVSLLTYRGESFLLVGSPFGVLFSPLWKGCPLHSCIVGNYSGG
jgi:hypothetical protein